MFGTGGSRKFVVAQVGARGDAGTELGIILVSESRLTKLKSELVVVRAASVQKVVVPFGAALNCVGSTNVKLEERWAKIPRSGEGMHYAPIYQELGAVGVNSRVGWSLIRREPVFTISLFRPPSPLAVGDVLNLGQQSGEILGSGGGAHIVVLAIEGEDHSGVHIKVRVVSSKTLEKVQSESLLVRKAEERSIVLPSNFEPEKRGKVKVELVQCGQVIPTSGEGFHYAAQLFPIEGTGTIPSATNVVFAFQLSDYVPDPIGSN